MPAPPVDDEQEADLEAAHATDDAAVDDDPTVVGRAVLGDLLGRVEVANLVRPRQVLGVRFVRRSRVVGSGNSSCHII
mgnify:CR=1 FL=1